MNEIAIYSDIRLWLVDEPDTVIKGEIVSRREGIIEIYDELGFTQIININKIYAVVFKRCEDGQKTE